MTNKVRIMFLVGLLISFFVGYVSGLCILTDKLTMEEYQLYESMAQDIYEQKEDVLMGIPKDIIVQITDSNITVRKSGCYGVIKGTVNGGILKLERDKETAKSRGFNVLSGMFSVLAYVIICGAIFGKKEEN